MESSENVVFVKPKAGVARWLSALRNTRDGFIYGISKEAAIREEVLLLCVGTPLAIAFAPSTSWLVAMVGSLLLLLVVESLNTAVELTLDRISMEFNETTKAAKDIGSFAVFMAILIVAAVWCGAIYV